MIRYFRCHIQILPRRLLGRANRTLLGKARSTCVTPYLRDIDSLSASAKANDFFESTRLAGQLFITVTIFFFVSLNSKFIFQKLKKNDSLLLQVLDLKIKASKIKNKFVSARRIYSKRGVQLKLCATPPPSFQGQHLRLCMPLSSILKTITRTWLSQTDRASAAHTIRRGYL